MFREAVNWILNDVFEYLSGRNGIFARLGIFLFGMGVLVWGRKQPERAARISIQPII